MSQSLDHAQMAECINAVGALLALGDVLALIREGEVLEKGTLTNYGYLVLREAKVIHEILEAT